eukprot:TRINITY_DN2261_c0_g1_i1.p2 TRINITY_DN2261_c0_g1~~TRINITY_DN2261_c0_g1_i1.p2  ORF type:complete len:246 (+),score=58.14 TRINITY_DN2261_c0_g1_i1:110-847(+)
MADTDSFAAAVQQLATASRAGGTSAFNISSPAGDMMLLIAQVLVMVLMIVDVLIDLMQWWQVASLGELWQEVKLWPPGFPMLPFLLIIKRLLLWMSLDTGKQQTDKAAQDAADKLASLTDPHAVSKLAAAAAAAPPPPIGAAAHPADTRGQKSTTQATLDLLDSLKKLSPELAAATAAGAGRGDAAAAPLGGRGPAPAAGGGANALPAGAASSGRGRESASSPAAELHQRVAAARQAAAARGGRR